MAKKIIVKAKTNDAIKYADGGIVGITIKEYRDGQLIVISPYNPVWVKKAKELGGKWDSGAKGWILNKDIEITIRETLKEIYGTDGSADEKKVDVYVNADKLFPNNRGLSELMLFGFTIAKRWYRDSSVKLHPNASILKGGFGSYHGSVKHPAFDFKENTVILVRDVPEGAYQNELKKHENAGEIFSIEKPELKINVPDAKSFDKIQELNNIDTSTYDYWYDRYSAWGKSEVNDAYTKNIADTSVDWGSNRLKALKTVAENKGIVLKPSILETKNPFIGDEFYNIHPENILGEQLTGQGRFGDRIVVKGSIDNLSKIEIPALPEKIFTGIPQSNLVDAEAGETVSQNIKKAIENEEKKAIKKTFKIDLPEIESDKIYTFAEIVKRYNKNVTDDEIQAWLYCHPELPAEKYTGQKELKLSKSDLIEKGLICYHNGTFEYKYIYASGLINKKISLLKRDKEKIIDLFGEKVWNYQMELLKSAMPKQKTLSDSIDNRIVIVPHSQIALSFKIDETMSEKFTSPLNLRDAFKSYLKNTLKSTDFKQSNSDEIIKYYIENKGVQIPGRLDDKEKDKLQKLNINIKQRTTAEGDKLFSQFLSENLLAEDRMKLEIIWNEKYNSLSPVNVSKIPIGFTMSKTFKDNKPLEISETQRNGIAFLAVKKSGVIAYDVGVGKTLTAILYASYALENGYSQYPLIIVPNNVYQKWIEDMQGFMDKEKGRFMMGAIPHYPKIRGLYNLNVDVVKTLKNYSESDQKQLDEYIEIITKATEERAKVLDKPASYSKLSEYFFKGKYGEIIKNGHERFVKEYEDNNAEIRYNDERNNTKTEPFAYKKTLNKKKVSISISEYILNQLIAHVKGEYNYAIYDLGTIKPVPSGTISVITYEGLQKLGLRDYKSIITQLYEILMQGDKFIEDEKAAANLYLKLEERVASSTSKAKLFMEDFQIDAFVFDEAHAAKKIFTSVKGETKGEIETDNFGNIIYDADGNPVKKVSVTERKTSSGKITQVDREKSHYELDSGAPSARALSTYILGRYIQQNNDNRNVVLLTATPFENNPLEIYSMLSLANHQELVQNGFSSIKDFFDTFMKLEYDIKVTAKNEVKKDLVLTGFRNLPQMRAIIRNVIDYKTGEEANVIRPNKIILPDYFNYNIETRFKMTLEQSEYMKDVEQYINDKDISLADICSRVWTNAEEEIEEAVDLESMTEDERKEYLAEQKRIEASGTKYSDEELTETDKEGVKILQGLSMMRAIALTPYYYKCKRIQTEKPTAEDYINSSPKLRYVMDCVKSVKEYHERNNSKMSGQVIYMNAAVQYFPQIAEYLTDPKFKIGYKEDEVQLIIGGMSQAQKEKIKRAFLNGNVKIIIGSKAIEVGVDLQENASCLYNLWYDWNPTTQAQIIGRIWRQGNRFANVRIVYPMCENSADPIMFQYLGEKTARIKEIWDQEGVKSQLDLKDFNPDDLKYKLITDPKKRVEIETIREADKLESDLMYLQNQRESIGKIKPLSEDFIRYRRSAVIIVQELNTALQDIEIEEINDQMSAKLLPLRNKLEDASGKDLKKIQDSIKNEKEKFSRKIEETKQSNLELIDKLNQSEFDNPEDEKQYNSLVFREAGKAAKWFDESSSSAYRHDSLQKYMGSKKQSDKDVLTRFRGIYKEFNDLKKNIIDPLGLSLDQLDEITTKFNQQIEELQIKISALEESKPARIEALKEQMKKDSENWKTPEDRAQEFASLNHLLEEMMQFKPKAVEADEVELIQPINETQVAERSRSHKKLIKAWLMVMIKKYAA